MSIEYIAFNYGELHLPLQALLECYHQGACDKDCEHWAKQIDWEAQSMTPQDIARELSDCGAWEPEELEDLEQNKARILWIAAGNYQEEQKGHNND